MRGERGGFSLLESVVCLMLLGTVSAAALASISDSMRSATRAIAAVEAGELAELKALSLGLAPLDSVRALAVDASPRSFPAPFDDYSWTLRLRFMSPSVWAVEVSVSGAEAHRRTSYVRAEP